MNVALSVAGRALPVIPGRREAASPESIGPQDLQDNPGSMLRIAPE